MCHTFMMGIDIVILNIQRRTWNGEILSLIVWIVVILFNVANIVSYLILRITQLFTYRTTRTKVLNGNHVFLLINSTCLDVSKESLINFPGEVHQIWIYKSEIDYFIYAREIDFCKVVLVLIIGQRHKSRLDLNLKILAGLYLEAAASRVGPAHEESTWTLTNHVCIFTRKLYFSRYGFWTIFRFGFFDFGPPTGPIAFPLHP